MEGADIDALMLPPLVGAAILAADILLRPTLVEARPPVLDSPTGRTPIELPPISELEDGAATSVLLMYPLVPGVPTTWTPEEVAVGISDTGMSPSVLIASEALVEGAGPTPLRLALDTGPGPEGRLVVTARTENVPVYLVPVVTLKVFPKGSAQVVPLLGLPVDEGDAEPQAGGVLDEEVEVEDGSRSVFEYADGLGGIEEVVMPPAADELVENSPAGAEELLLDITMTEAELLLDPANVEGEELDAVLIPPMVDEWLDDVLMLA
ncbi:hypothetical protein LTR36_010195 [Oleoguttula mirabilis]|uniref:Uncharacterized protein n=1 Tax=Oleoguttula mirabilis TaxID=1507867 RepID=A0AAV9JSU9_9PEZI|nr:hypothetical protein LTR36_010195 [Oleoguttula mirabilis]